MEKIIYIGNKEVKLKANAMQALIFRKEFGRDIMEVQGSLMNIVNIKPKGDIYTVGKAPTLPIHSRCRCRHAPYVKLFFAEHKAQQKAKTIQK